MAEQTIDSLKETPFAGWEYVIEETDHGLQYKTLGAGGYGSVFEIKKEGSIDFRSAMKIISIPRDEYEIKQYVADGNSENQIQLILDDRKAGAIEEINLLIQLRYNPNIVDIEDYAIKEKDDGPGWDIYIRMEPLTSINEVEIAVRKGEADPFGEEEVRKLGVDICSALEECHSSGLLHRDIKPHNIFVDKDGRYKLGDFGISRVLDETTGIISATMTDWYAAPEVMRFEKGRVTSDLYSLGLVMYELLNDGRMPFMPSASRMIRADDKTQSLGRRIRGESIEPIEGVSEQLNAIILKACAFDPKDRFASAREMKEALKQGIEEPKETTIEPEPKSEMRAEDTSMTAVEQAKKDMEELKRAREEFRRQLEGAYAKARNEAEQQDEQGDFQAIRITDRTGQDVLFTKNAVNIKGEEFLYTEIEEIRHSQVACVYGFKCNDAGHLIWYEEKDAKVIDQAFSEVIRLKTRGAAADFEAGDAYYYGIGREKDYKKAIVFYKKAAESLNPKAYFMLGKAYEEGNGVVKDYKEATRWYASAANAGNQYAQVRLGKMYESGKGIGHDLKEAAKWYEKAADQGNNNAKWHLQKVKAKMGE